MNHKPSAQDIRACRSAEKTTSDRINFPYSHYCLDWVALRVASMFVGVGVRANTVTAFNFALLLVALSVILGGAVSPWCFVLGGLLLHGVLILDNVDGHVARFNQSTSKLGAFSDSLATWCQYAALPLCVGFALTIAEPEGWESRVGFQIPAWTWLVAGTVRSVGYLLTVVISERGKELLGLGDYNERVASLGGLVVLKGAIETEALFLVVAPFLSLVGPVHLGYALLHSLVFCLVLIKNIADLRTSDRERMRP